jgi:hypothetical protein
MMTEPKFKERLRSRKFVLMVLILLGGAGVLIAPVVLKLIAGIKLASVLTGGEFVSLVIGSYGIYSGANVFSEKTKNKNDQ